jgi:hypothetical protein
MASRHVHGRAQGRVLGLSQGAGSLGRFLGPWIAAFPLPANFSEVARPLPAAFQPLFAQGYIVAFSTAAALLLASFVVVAIMKPLEIDTPGEAA